MKREKHAAPIPQTPKPTDVGLFEGTVVRHVNRHTGFGNPKERGIVQGFIEPEPGWHRVLVAWQDIENDFTTEQFIDTDKLEVDAIETLSKLCHDAGCVMTLYGVPVTADELRAKAEAHAINRLTDAVVAKAGDQLDLFGQKGPR